jgi:hypothetical protein
VTPEPPDRLLMFVAIAIVVVSWGVLGGLVWAACEASS